MTDENPDEVGEGAGEDEDRPDEPVIDPPDDEEDDEA